MHRISHKKEEGPVVVGYLSKRMKCRVVGVYKQGGGRRRKKAEEGNGNRVSDENLPHQYSIASFC